jgi:outer membrane protein OmpA-like peptidoglycan-associated protein
MRRAEEVAKQLTQSFGIDASRITTASEGENSAVAEGMYDVNRRVDVVVQ